jgi:hydrogenase-4 component B
MTVFPGMEPAWLLCVASFLAALSGLPLLLMPSSLRAAGQRLAAAAILAASLLGILGALAAILNRSSVLYTLERPFPMGPLEWGLDPLSAFFALPILLVAACCALYGLEYWPARGNPGSVGRLTLFFGLLVGSMLWVVMARSAIVFLAAWEVMAMAAFFCLATEHVRPEVREAGTLYLITTHLGTLALFPLFALLKLVTGDFLFPAAASLAPAPPLAAAIFLTALVAFGLKAGIMPLHVWLPSAHANAPSHISAFMSGVILKIGIYGLVRALSFFAVIPLWWGVMLLVLGMVSAVAGVAFALGQHDLKRLLAYHSIENIGIIVMGLGVALLGAAGGTPLLVLLGLGGALLHVVNHATFKALLFLGAGSVIHAAGTREMERLGGLLRPMPWTAGLFLAGAVAICGLPPLNGFVSELLVYLGLFEGASGGHAVVAAVSALAVPALALVGGLALACFAKVFGVVFLGAPRSVEAERGHEAGWRMRGPMLVLALVCGLIGLFPTLAAPLLDGAVASWRPQVVAATGGIAAAAPLQWLTLLALVLIALALGGIALFLLRLQRRPLGESPTWGCGYLAPTPRMQYSASSFAQILVGQLAGILRPAAHFPVIRGLFPRSSSFESHVPEAVLEKCYLPFLERANARLSPVRRLQHGQLHLYILYVFLTLVTLLSL